MVPPLVPELAPEFGPRQRLSFLRSRMSPPTAPPSPPPSPPDPHALVRKGPARIDSGYHTVATYRLADPIENMKLEVTLRKRGTRGERLVGEASDKPRRSRRGKKKKPKPERDQARRRRRRPTGDDEAEERGEEEEDDDGDGDDDEGEDAEEEEEEEEEPLPEKPARSERLPLRGGEEEDDRTVATAVFHWQEKVFSPTEVSDVRQTKREGPGLLGRFFRGRRDDFARTRRRELLAQYDAETKARTGGDYQGQVLHSWVDWENDRDAADYVTRYTSSEREEVTPLARAVLTGSNAETHRDALGEGDCMRMAIMAELPLSELPPPPKLMGVESVGERVKGRLAGREEKQFGLIRLCSLRLSSGGRLDVRPPLAAAAAELEAEDPTLTAEAAAAASDEGWHRVPNSRYEWRLRNLADEPPKPDWAGADKAAADKPDKAAGAAAAGTAGTAARAAAAVLGLDFSMPSGQAARLHYFCNLQAAEGFGPESLYVQYFAHAAPGWRLAPQCVATAITQKSVVRGAEQRAILSFPIELTLESDGAPTAARPPLTLFFSVNTLDAFGRHTALGYAHVPLPGRTGCATHRVRGWVPVTTRYDAQRNFFVGGSEELHDLRALSIPEGFGDGLGGKGALNRHGLQTLSTGSVEVSVNTVLQQHQIPVQPLAAGALGGADAAAAAKSFNANNTLRAISTARTLGASETAADRVKRRLEERRSRERIAGGGATAPPRLAAS